MRLLTEEEREIYGLHTHNLSGLQVLRNAPLKIEITEGLKAQDAKTHKETLKAVGRWLKKSISLDELWTWEPDIETLLRGEMPLRYEEFEDIV